MTSNRYLLYYSQNVLHLLFRLFDHQSSGLLTHSDFIEGLKAKKRYKDLKLLRKYFAFLTGHLLFKFQAKK